jgi:UDP-N-acetylmuramyl pentapeptide synthase
MRGEIMEVAGRQVIVDCYNANPASMTAALHALAERAHGAGLEMIHGPRSSHGHAVTAIAVLGDMLELGSHGPAAHHAIGELARELHIGVVALGELGRAIAESAGGELADSPADAAGRALARTRTGDWILLKASRGMRLERVLEAMRQAT